MVNVSGPPTDRCTGYQPDVMCKSRREAIGRGEMYYSRTHQGWVYPAPIPTARMSTITHKKPYTWPHCPFCGGAISAPGSVSTLLIPPPAYRPVSAADGEGDEVGSS